MKKRTRAVAMALALALVTSTVPAELFAFDVVAAGIEKPADGTSPSGEVFPTGVSSNFRIPGLVNFKGELIASADARWDNEKDGGGMDLVVSRSDDGGTSWDYTFAGYLGDNGNAYNANSTTLMDPVIITDGETLYLLADMYPAGYSISSSSTANVFSDTAIGFDGNGKLLLSGDGRSSYGYYLDGGKIHKTNGTAVSDYTVDGWFNLYEKGTYVTNLFFADSPYQVRATSYFCMMTSTDGKTWSDPTLLNVKPEGVSWMVLGPGSGLVTKDGDIAFTAYDGSNIYLIYGKDGVWNTVKTSAATNESSIIELNDGTIRAFVKRGGNNTIAYVDFTKSGSGYAAGSLVDTGVANFSQCMVSSLHYSRTYGGEEVVLVCCPSLSSGGAWAGRFNGKVYAFTLDDKNAMTLVGSHQLNSSFFAYSNMAEMDDGTLAVLYEDDCISYSAGNYYGDASHITFTKVDLETALGITFDAVTLTDSNTDVSVTAPDLSRMEITKLAKSEPVPGFSRSATYSIKLYNSKGQLYSAKATVKLPVTDGLDACERYIGSVDGELFEVAAPVDGYFTVTVPHFSDVTISGYVSGDPATVNLKLYKGTSRTVTLDGWAYTDANITSAIDSAVATMDIQSSTTPATKKLQEVTEIISGKQYLIVHNPDRGGKVLTSSSNNGGLHMDGKADVDNTNLWTFVSVGENLYQVRYGTDGDYLSVGGSSAGVTATETTLYIPYQDGYWYICDQTNTYGLNQFGGATSSKAAGWDGRDAGSQWHIYEIVEEGTVSTTQFTFAGVEVGTTTATVGHVTFNIEVLDVNSAVEGNIEGFTGIVGTQTYTQTDDKNSVALTGKPITKLTISAGSTFASLGVDIANADAVIWSSGNTGVATVDQNGKVTAVAEGETEISVKVIKDGIAETVTIPVRVIPSLIPADSTAATDISLSYIEAAYYVDVYFSLYSSTGYAQELKQVQTGEVVYFTRPINIAYGMVWMSAPVDGDKFALTYMAATGTAGQYHPLLPAGHATTEPCYCQSDAFKNLTGSNVYGADSDMAKAMLAKAVATGCTGAMSQGRKVNTAAESMVTSLTFAAERLPEVDKTLNGILPGGGKAPTFRRYAGERMTGEVGDYVYFTISITQEAPRVFNPEKTDAKYSLVEFSLATLTDTIVEGNGTEYYFYTKDQDTNYDGVIDNNDGTGYQQLKAIDVKDDLNSSWTDEEIAAGKRVKEYYVVYKIVDDDLELTFADGQPVNQIENSVEFAYSFESYYDYSKGTTTGAAAAAAHMLVVGEYVGEFVVDFGLPLVITITGAEHGNTGFQYMDTSVSGWYSAKYGKVDFLWKEGKETDTTDDDVFEITYTPTSVLPTADEVLLYRKEGEKTVVNSFSVVPATSVYYEDTFIDEDTNWVSDGTSAGLIQDADTLGDVNDDGVAGNIDPPIKNHPYGYDDAYKNTNGPSNGTQIFTGTKDATASFTFTGTGFELYANCTESTGTVQVDIRQQDGDYEFTYIVNTAAGVGSSAATSGQTGKFYSLPIVSRTDLERGTYTVTLTKLDRQAPAGDELGKVYIDGFRVFGTVQEAAGESSLYFYDQEDHPEFFELRDSVLTALDLSQIDRDYLLQIIDKQIFDQRVGSAIVFGAGVPYGTKDNAQDLLDNGPKNELFLWSGQTLTFKVTTDRLMQIGLKAPQGATDVEITVGNEKNEKITAITSSVDMFYELNSKPAGETTYTVYITNKGDKVLSVTKLKICDDPDATFENLTAEDIEDALIGLDLLPERTYADATANVTLVDYAGNEIGSVVLHKNGAVGRAAVFTAAEILAAARQQLPEHYAFVNEEAVMDAAVAFGSSRTVFVQVGQVATVRITYISLSQRKVCTVTVTKVQFTAGPCRISATELKRYSPFGRTLLVLGGISAQYGQVTEVTVTVI